jgi:hypothetical protein
LNLTLFWNHTRQLHLCFSSTPPSLARPASPSFLQ